MPVNSSTGSYNFVKYQFSRKNYPVLHAGEGSAFRPFSCTSSCLGVVFLRKYEEFIDVQSPIG
jgi:hypothetical protein